MYPWYSYAPVYLLFVLVFSILYLLSYVCMHQTCSFYSIYVRVGMSGKRKSKWDQPALDSVEETSTIPPATSKWDQPAVGSGGKMSGIPLATSKWDQQAVGSGGETSGIPPATSKWDQQAVGSGGETSGIPPATSKWDQQAVGSGGETSGIPPATSKWDQPAVGSSGEMSGIPPTTSKWDQPAVGSSCGNTKTGKRWDSPSTSQKPSSDVGSNLAAEALARITSMLATQKRQTASEPVSHTQQLIHPHHSIHSIPGAHDRYTLHHTFRMELK